MQRKLETSKLASQAGICEEALLEAASAAASRGAPADKTLAAFFRARRNLGSRDRSLASMGVFAVFRWWGWLKPLSGGSYERLSRKDCAKLLLASFVCEGGELPSITEALRQRAGASFPEIEDLTREPVAAKRAAKALSALGFAPPKPLEPEALIPSWALPELSKAALKPRLFETLQSRPPIWIRVQKGEPETLVERLREAGLAPEAHPRVRNALKLQGVKANLRELKEFKQGLFEIQDLSSQCIGLACQAKPGESWWDVCAGGGGKSLQLASMMRGKGSIRSTDTRAYKLDDLMERAARASFSNIRPAAWDGSAPDPKRRAVFDGVLVDAPCSSSGRWRRNPDARWTAKASWVDELREIQLKILEAASVGVKPGGILVYATCSMFFREDAENLESFLKIHPDFILEPFENPLNGEKTDGSLLTLPWDADCDASFVARLRRKA